MTKFLRIPVEGHIEVVDLAGLEALQAQVGGWIEVVSIPDYHTVLDYTDLELVINEEGKIHGLPINHRASLLFGTNHHGDPIVGTALVTMTDDHDGELVDVDPWLVLRVLGDRLAEALVSS